MWRRWQSTGGVEHGSSFQLSLWEEDEASTSFSYSGIEGYCPATSLRSRPSSSSPYTDSNSGDSNRNDILFAETKKLTRLVIVEVLKRKLGMEGKKVIRYSELLQACESKGVARSLEEAAAYAQVLDKASVVLLFRDKVYLHPHKSCFGVVASWVCGSLKTTGLRGSVKTTKLCGICGSNLRYGGEKGLGKTMGMERRFWIEREKVKVM